jgi:hypothetical protein
LGNGDLGYLHLKPFEVDSGGGGHLKKIVLVVFDMLLLDGMSLMISVVPFIAIGAFFREFQDV